MHSMTRIAAAGLAIALITTPAFAQRAPKTVQLGPWDMRGTYFVYLSCVDDVLKQGGSFAQSAKPCAKHKKKYVDQILRETKKKGGWSGLHSSVQPAVNKLVDQQTLQVFRNMYGIRK